MARINGSFSSIFLLSASLLLAACGPAKKSSGIGSPVGTASTKSAYAGTWVKPCAATGSSNFGSRQKLVITETRVELIGEGFGTADCSGAPVTSVTILADYSVGGPVAAPANTKMFDMIARSAKMTSLTDSATTALNAQSYCGVTTWVTNQAKSLRDLTCPDVEKLDAGDIDYSIIKVDGNKLYIGKPNEGSAGRSETNRDTQLESIAYVKQ